eukprot:349641-Chlamydomonas_euryale.AAC.8
MGCTLCTGWLFGPCCAMCAVIGHCIPERLPYLCTPSAWNGSSRHAAADARARVPGARAPVDRGLGGYAYAGCTKAAGMRC